MRACQHTPLHPAYISDNRAYLLCQGVQQGRGDSQHRRGRGGLSLGLVLGVLVVGVGGVTAQRPLHTVSFRGKARTDERRGEGAAHAGVLSAGAPLQTGTVVVEGTRSFLGLLFVERAK